MRNFRSHIVILGLLFCMCNLYANGPVVQNFEEDFIELRKQVELCHKSTIDLFQELETQLNLNEISDQGFEFYLLKTKFYFDRRNDDQARESLKLAKPFYEKSSNELFKLKFESLNLELNIFNSSDLDEIKLHHKKALELQDPLSIVNAKALLTRMYHKNLKHDSAQIVAKEAFQLADNHNLKEEKGSITQMLGTIEYNKSNYEKALELLEEAGRYYKEANKELGYASILNTSAIIYRKKGLYNQALKILYASLEIFERYEVNTSIGFIYNNIGNLQEKLGEPAKAIENFERAKEYMSEKISERHISYINTNIGKSYLQLGEYEKAEKALLEGIKTKEKIEDLYFLSFSYNTLGQLYLKQSKISAALEQFEKALKTSKQVESNAELSHTYLGLAKISLYNNDNKSMIDYGKLALEIAQENEDLDDQYEALSFLSEAYAKIQNYERSLSINKKSALLKDSIINVQKAKELQNISSKYENQQKELKIVRLENENLKKDTIIQSNKQQSRIFALLALGSLLILSLFGWNFFQKQKTNLELETLNNALQESNSKYQESNAQLKQFAHIASHDLKAPIRTITSFAGLLRTRSKDKLDEKENKFLNYIEQSGQNLTRMVDDLLAYSKVDNQQINITQVDGNKLLQEVFTNLTTQAQEKQVQLTSDTTLPIIKADEIKIKRVFQNLISNAIKFSDPKKDSFIKVASMENENEWIFTIIDNGIGIEDTDKDLFEPFTYLNNSDEYKGTGMGLAFCKKIINRHGGTISYTSEVGEQTEFRFSIKKQSTV